MTTSSGMKRDSAVRRIRPYLIGAALVIVGFMLAKLPTWLVVSGRISVFKVAEDEAALLHVTAGCQGSMWAIKNYETDRALQAVSIPVTFQAQGARVTNFHQLVCTLGLNALIERDHWWVRLVERDAACKSLWDGEREFLETHKLHSWPQFSNGDTMVMSFDSDGLRQIGVEKVIVGDRKVYRGIDK